ncbi:hypothetical protein HOY80DRAFT_946393 [Tuber brumale]|nr:hypothetical protein HOY80DRAFT_946393 [Tuber brumale]
MLLQIYTIQYNNHIITPFPLALLALPMVAAITLAAVSFRFMPLAEALTSVMPLSVVVAGCGFMMWCFVEEIEGGG